MTLDDTREDSQNPGRSDLVRRPYFGRRLKELRENYPSRITAGRAGMSLVPVPSTSRLVGCLRTHDVSISTAAYNEIEQGFNVPRHAVAFLNGVATCLELTKDEKDDLTQRLAYDILWARLRDLTDTILPPNQNWTPPPQDW